MRHGDDPQRRGRPGSAGNPDSDSAGGLGPGAARLLAALELRLTVRTLVASGLLALAALILWLELLAAGLAFGGPAVVDLAERAGRWLPVAAIAAAALALLALVRRPGRVYLASLIEKARPELAGQLVLLAEHQAGRAELQAGAAELMAGRVEGVLGRRALGAGQAAAEDRPRRTPSIVLGAVLAAGLALAAAGGGRYLEALGELCGVTGAGPTRIAAVEPGNVVLDEGLALTASCRTAGRAPRSVTLVAGDLRTEMRRDAGGAWRAELLPRGSGRYSVVAQARSGPVQAGPFDLRVRPRPLARVERVTYRYPGYTGVPPRESDSPEIDCLLGATADLRIAARGPVGAVELRLNPGGTIAARRGGDGLWRAEVRVVRVGSYSIWVAPEGGGAAREVGRGSVTARADLAPTAAALARRLSDGRVAVDYRVADDYRLGPARMIFVSGGKRRAYEVPDVPGRRESQGAVVVPAEVLAAADGIFRYRLEVADTHSPEPNRATSSEQEFQVERQVAMAGPVLEKPPQMAGSHQRPSSTGGTDAGGSAGSPATRPLESLYKPEDGAAKPPPKGGGADQNNKAPDDPYMAPSGGEPEEPPPAKKPGGEPGKGPENPGEPGTAPQQPAVNTPKLGGPDAGGSGGGEDRNTPGGTSPGGGRPGSGSDGGGSKPVEKPPSGSETGVGQSSPERVIPRKVNMDMKPGEVRAPLGAAPGPLRTDWGGARRPQPGSGGGPGSVRAPEGSLGSGPLPAADRDPRLGAIAPAAQVAPRYRRYISDYLEALSAEGPGR